MLKIVIIGLPNAGKSTLFNRLVRRKAAVVSDIPGVTRDRREGIGRISDLEFKVIDTGGWNDQTSFSLQVIEQIEFSLLSADVIFFLVDAKVQNEQNKEFAKWLKRKTNKPVILIANKCESHKSENVDYLQFFNFIGPVYISAEHNLGMIDLYDVLAGVIEDFNKKTELPESESIRLRIAIIGRPNVGKSTFLNSLLAENRLIVSSKPGTTRDSVDISYDHNGKLITLIDTAGIRRKANVVDNLESRFVEKSIESIKRSHVVILMLDSLLGVEQQDLSIAEAAIKGGKGIIIVLNKWDLIGKDDRSKLIKFVKQQEVTRLFLEVPTVTISALKGMRCGDVIDKCLEVSESLNKKISTAKLNNWLIDAVEKHSHPLIKGRAIKMKYIAQIGTKPPAFSLVCNVPESVDESYKRYLTNGLRKNFFVEGVPVRLLLKKNKNPYVK
ncbi:MULTISPECIES: ribosome biogenesis GTPase Der [unclassified Wolbachia]|uniref:ribosome biogenesis GTPase Der n=1 Tax=unclassified Wolbachia TaxID=2640676 RepID=UPI0007D0AF6D|nr:MULTISPECIES: ribosome biogenesis GTPase Der [unclassified Wolbachia]MBR9983288.1 ribosome biogenesis GTPase Der [Wolbachia endosymbiont of Homalodisca vitripennis]MCJ7454801.1 ribosome biogenesis GTPase Der [Wolbachia endosymbiont of Homalodisca vitripennis]MCJ7475709.1 ribosome biogenesis GTPase Der [Wolbachia endosymbiont of Homalodisca vitripennis]OAM05742.1 MAG: ribosome biogenesis GTPase Der [Wolbachia endosymbiont of Dactylopius coccus]